MSEETWTSDERAAGSSTLRLGAEAQKRLRRLDQLAILLDESIRIPGSGYRIGYDAVIGLVPGIGDLAGLLVGSYIVVEAARFRIPKTTLARMVANVAVEALAGMVPVVGDVFDAVYKANLRNIRLLHRRLETADRSPVGDRLFLIVLLLLPVALLAAMAALLFYVAALLF
jgi:hypothetical protein